jgi:hypothetical protein
VIAQERIESGDQKEVRSPCEVSTLLPTERSPAYMLQQTFEIGNDCDPVYPEHWPEEEERPGFKEVRECQFPSSCFISLNCLLPPADYEQVSPALPSAPSSDPLPSGHVSRSRTGLLRGGKLGPRSQSSPPPLPSRTSQWLFQSTRGAHRLWDGASFSLLCPRAILYQTCFEILRLHFSGKTQRVVSK